MRELPNKGESAIDPVLVGEHGILGRSGCPVAQPCPSLPREPDPVTLRARWRHIPDLDPAALRQDIDQVIDPSL